MAKVTGIGGVFLKCDHPDEMRAWYQKHLGIPMESWGGMFFWKADPHPEPYTVISFSSRSSHYFDPSTAPFMINFRVDNLSELLQQLHAAGAELVGEPQDGEYGKFAWVLDPEGNKIELWEQPKGDK